GAAPALDHGEMDDPVLIAELSNPAFLAAGDSNDVAVFAATLTHPLTHGRDPLCFIKRGRQCFFSIRITSSPERRRNPVGGSLTVLLTALERAQEAGPEAIVHAHQPRVGIVAVLFVARLR